MKKHYSLCIFSCIFSVIAELLVVANSVVMGDVIDIATQGNINAMFCNSVLMIGILLANNIIFTISVYLNLQFANLRTIDLRNAIVRNVFQKPLWHFRKADDAYYINMLYGDVDKLNSSVYQNYSIEWKFLALFAFSLLMIARVNFYLFLISIVFSLLPMIVTVLLQNIVNEQGSKCSESDEEYQRRVAQTVQGYECIKTKSDPATFISKFFQPAVIKKGKTYVKKESVQTIAYSAVDCVNSLGQLILIIAGGYMVVEHKISTGELVTCVMLSSYVYSGMNNFLETFLERQTYSKIQKKVENEAAYIEAKKSEDVCDFGVNNGVTLQYDHVNFCIEDNRIIDNFSFVFKAGMCYGIVGESGKGKTTLVQLALKYYDDFEGKILLNGKDIRLLDERSLYKCIGYLSQSEYMFQDTIENNILLYSGDGEISEEIIKQCRLSGLVSRMKEGNIGDMGEHLSGGEKQRVALARVLTRQPSLLIFDEPTVGLDADNASEIMDTVFSLEGVTRIVISHDESIMKDSRFDEVILLS